MLSVTPGLPSCDDEMRGTTVELSTEATSEMRLSVLGTAHVWRSPTKGEVAVPLPLPEGLLPPAGCAPPVAAMAPAPLADDAEFAAVCGLSGWSTGTLAAVFAVD